MLILAATQALRKAFSLSPESPSDQAEAERALEKARGKLDPTAFRNAWEEGSRMTLVEAMDLARREADLCLNPVGDIRTPDAVQYALLDGS